MSLEGAEAVRVKEEPGWETEAGAQDGHVEHEVKKEPKWEIELASRPGWYTELVAEEEFESKASVQTSHIEHDVKEDPGASKGACGVSAAGARAGLYPDHTVKEELVVGPEELHRPKMGWLHPAERSAVADRACSVRLERMRVDLKHLTCRIGPHTYKFRLCLDTPQDNTMRDIMPRNTDSVKLKRVFFKYKEDDVIKAIDEISKGAKIRETCRKYNIPHSTIVNTIKLRHPVQRKMGPPTILTPQEESLLKSWIIAMARKGFPVTKQMVLEAVKSIIEEDQRPNPFKDDKPGRKWFTSFLKRHEDIAVLHAESINIAFCLVTETALRKWHANLKEYLIAEGVADILEDPERILNAHESGFQTNPSSGLVLGPRGCNNIYEAKEKVKECITVMGTFAASGTILPPLIIYPYERIPFKILGKVNEEWGVGKSEKGWMTSKVFYGYIANTLIPRLKENWVKFPVLLLIDGHKSHVNREVTKLCIDVGIILYSLIPNATHIIQPANVSVFRPLKNSWKKIVSDWKLKTGNRCVTKALFAPLLEATFNDISEDVIRNGFRKCGLYPFDANAISYENCMTNTSRPDKPDKLAIIGPEHLLYFESLMPSTRIPEFRAAKDSSWTGDESAKELFYVWQKITRAVTENTSHPDEQEKLAGKNHTPDEQLKEVSYNEGQPEFANQLDLINYIRTAPVDTSTDLPSVSLSEAAAIGNDISELR